MANENNRGSLEPDSENENNTRWRLFRKSVSRKILKQLHQHEYVPFYKDYLLDETSKQEQAYRDVEAAFAIDCLIDLLLAGDYVGPNAFVSLANEAVGLQAFDEANRLIRQDIYKSEPNDIGIVITEFLGRREFRYGRDEEDALVVHEVLLDEAENPMAEFLYFNLDPGVVIPDFNDANIGIRYGRSKGEYLVRVQKFGAEELGINISGVRSFYEYDCHRKSVIPTTIGVEAPIDRIGDVGVGRVFTDLRLGEVQVGYQQLTQKDDVFNMYIDVLSFDQPQSDLNTYFPHKGRDSFSHKSRKRNPAIYGFRFLVNEEWDPIAGNSSENCQVYIAGKKLPAMILEQPFIGRFQNTIENEMEAGNLYLWADVAELDKDYDSMVFVLDHFFRLEQVYYGQRKQFFYVGPVPFEEILPILPKRWDGIVSVNFGYGEDRRDERGISAN